MDFATPSGTSAMNENGLLLMSIASVSSGSIRDEEVLSSKIIWFDTGYVSDRPQAGIRDRKPNGCNRCADTRHIINKQFVFDALYHAKCVNHVVSDVRDVGLVITLGYLPSTSIGLGTSRT